MNRAEAAHSPVSSTARATPLDQTLDMMRHVLEQRFGIDASMVTLEQRIDALGLDSLSFVEYAFELEKEMSILLPDLPRDLVTVGDLARLVQAHVDAQIIAASANE